MGFFDKMQNTVSNTINRGANATSRTTRTFKLRTQINDINKQRATLAAQLGASLYEVTRNDPAYTTGREALYDGIAQLDDQRAQLQAEIDRIEAEAAEESAARRTYTCQNCGTTVREGDKFCSGCGRPVADIKAEEEARRAKEAEEAQAAADAAANALICPNCGGIINEGDKFCISCGKPIDLEAVHAEGSPSNPIVEDPNESDIQPANPVTEAAPDPIPEVAAEKVEPTPVAEPAEADEQVDGKGEGSAEPETEHAGENTEKSQTEA